MAASRGSWGMCRGFGKVWTMARELQSTRERKLQGRWQYAIHFIKNVEVVCFGGYGLKKSRLTSSSLCSWGWPSIPDLITDVCWPWSGLAFFLLPPFFPPSFSPFFPFLCFFEAGSCYVALLTWSLRTVQPRLALNPQWAFSLSLLQRYSCRHEAPQWQLLKPPSLRVIMFEDIDIFNIVRTCNVYLYQALHSTC